MSNAEANRQQFRMQKVINILLKSRKMWIGSAGYAEERTVCVSEENVKGVSASIGVLRNSDATPSVLKDLQVSQVS